jgi:hypothetical protein
MCDGVEHKFCRKCKNWKHVDKPIWRSDKWAGVTSQHKSAREWCAERSAAKNGKPDRNFSSPKNKDGKHDRSSVSTFTAGPKNEATPPNTRLRLTGSLQLFSGAADSSTGRPHRPDPPAAFATMDEEEEKASESAPRHFDDDSAPDNCSFASDDSLVVRLNFQAGRR